MKPTIQGTLAAFPPNVVRLLARTGRGHSTRRLTHHEIVKASGLTYAKVRALSAKTSWDKVTIADADAFLAACGVTLKNLWRHSFFLKRSIDPRKTSRPLAYTGRRGRPQAPPAPAVIVEAALNRSGGYPLAWPSSGSRI